MKRFHFDLPVYVVDARHAYLLPAFGRGIDQRLSQQTGVVWDSLLLNAEGCSMLRAQVDFRRRASDE